MKNRMIWSVLSLLMFSSSVSHAMDDEQPSWFVQMVPDLFTAVLTKLTPNSNKYLYTYSKADANTFIATFAALRLVCKTFHSVITVEKFAELFGHEELSYIYYNKLCLYDEFDTKWLYLVTKSVGTTVQCPAPLLAVWKSAADKKFPNNRIPREYFLAKAIHSSKSEHDSLSVVKILVEAGTNVSFEEIELDRWLFQCVAHAAPLYNAVEKKFPSVVRFLVEKGAPIDSNLLDSAQRNQPDMHKLLLELQSQKVHDSSFCVVQ
jgi:hypothetical protein